MSGCTTPSFTYSFAVAFLVNNSPSKQSITYHKQIIYKYFPQLIRDKEWSNRTRLRILVIRLWPELFGKLSLKIKINFEK